MNLPHIEPIRLARAMRDDETRRAIEARLAGRPRHVTIEPLELVDMAQVSSKFIRRLGNAATIAIAVFCIVYFAGQFLRSAF